MVCSGRLRQTVRVTTHGLVSADKCAVTQIRRYVGAGRARRLHKVSQTFVLRNRIDLIL